MAALARENPLHVRFIEMMPIGLGKEFTARGEEQIKGCSGEGIRVNDTDGRETWEMAPVIIIPWRSYRQDRIISALSHKFCDSCNRVRLTSTGFLKGLPAI